MDMDIDEIIEQIVDYLIENSEDIISLLEEKERNELADLIYTEITEEFQQRKAVEVLKDAIEIVKGGGIDGNKTDFIQYRDGPGDSGWKEELYETLDKNKTKGCLWFLCNKKNRWLIRRNLRIR